MASIHRMRAEGWPMKLEIGRILEAFQFYVSGKSPQSFKAGKLHYQNVQLKKMCGCCNGDWVS